MVAGIAIVTVLLAWVAFSLRPSGVSSDDVRRSALRATPDGVAALHRAIARLGTPTALRLTPVVDAEPLRGTLVMLQPRRRPSPREVHELLEWVRGGGTLIHSPRSDSPILDSLGLVRRELEGADRTDTTESDSMLRDTVAPTPEARATTIQDAADDDPGDIPLWAGGHPLTAGLPTAGPSRYAIVPDTASDDEQDEEQGEERDEEARRHPVPFLPLLLTASDADGHRWTAVASIPLGEGRVIVISDAEPLSNRQAGEAPVAVLAARAAIAYTSQGDTVYFDEFSHGLGRSRSPVGATTDFLVGTPVGRVSLHLGLVVLLALACAGTRFGSALAPEQSEGRSTLEHVAALAAVYQSAQARETAAVLMLARLARVSRLPPPRNAAEALNLVKTLEHRTGARHALRRIRRGLAANPVNLAAIARGIDDHAQGSAIP